MREAKSHDVDLNWGHELLGKEWDDTRNLMATSLLQFYANLTSGQNGLTSNCAWKTSAALKDKQNEALSPRVCRIPMFGSFLVDFSGRVPCQISQFSI